jgi:hypothetical protein
MQTTNGFIVTTLAIIFFISILTWTGCMPIMKKIYGIKNPDIENEITIKKKANKFGLDTTNIFSVNASDFLRTFKDAGGIPAGAIFNSEGNYIEYRETDTSCNAGLFKFIPGLNTVTTYNKTGKTTLDNELNKYRDLKGNKISQANLKPADFYLFLYWTIWTGKLNKDHVKVWEQLARDNTKAKIEIIKVNLDIQEYWDKAGRDEIIRKMSKK